MDHFLYHILKVIFEYVIKEHEKVNDDAPKGVYVNKKKITFRMKIKY